MTDPSNEELASRYFDRHIAPALGGIPEDGTAHLRARYIQDAVASPEALRQLRQGDLVDEVFYLAICQDCTPVLPQPFFDPAERDKWARLHKDGTGHDVVMTTQLCAGWLRHTTITIIAGNVIDVASAK